MEGWFYTLQAAKQRNDSQLEKQSMRSCSFKEWGVCVDTDPLKTLHLTINTDSRYIYSKLIMTVVHTMKLLYYRSYRS